MRRVLEIWFTCMHNQFYEKRKQKGTWKLQVAKYDAFSYHE